MFTMVVGPPPPVGALGSPATAAPLTAAWVSPAPALAALAVACCMGTTTPCARGTPTLAAIVGLGLWGLPAAARAASMAAVTAAAALAAMLLTAASIGP